MLFTPTESQCDLFEQLKKELNLKESVINEIYNELEESFTESNYTVIEMTYLGIPKAQPRARYSSRLGAMYDGSKSLKQAVIEQVQHSLPKNFKPTEDAIKFNALFYLPIPKKYSKKDQLRAELGLLRPISKPDKDNLEKLLYDALKSVLYKDDSCIVGGNAEKFYSSKPRVEIKLWIPKYE
jgi:Holliday junction resolvase RusA-like endonuclease